MAITTAKSSLASANTSNKTHLLANNSNKKLTTSKIGNTPSYLANKRATNSVSNRIANMAITTAKSSLASANTSNKTHLLANNSNKKLITSKIGNTPSYLGNKRATNSVSNRIANMAITTAKSSLTSSNTSDKTHLLTSIEFVRDPISGKIVSKSDFQKGIVNSVEIAKKNTFKPNVIVKDPISGKPTDIFSLVANSAKRSNFNQGIAKTIEKKGDVKFSDAVSGLEAATNIGEVVTPKKFSDLKNALGFWSQTSGGVAKFTTYAEIGIDITKGDFNLAAENILKVGLDAASASTVFWALSGSPPPIQMGATVLAGIYGGDVIISTKNFLSKYSKKDLTPTLSEPSHYNQSNTPGKLRIINQMDNLKQSISIENKKSTGISSTGTIKIEPAQIILLGKE
ncbi:hypothetical protein [Ursidibacter sp. B-7004-1]